jgi:hypothetical protein
MAIYTIHKISLRSRFSWFSFLLKCVEWKIKQVISQKELLVTFDDGYRSDYSASLVLRFLKLPSVHFINPCSIGKKGYLTEHDVRRMSGWTEFGSHTYCHNTSAFSGDIIWPSKGKGIYNELVVNQFVLSDYELWLYDNLLKSKVYIEGLTSKPCLSLAWPWGESDSRMNSIASKVGYLKTYNTQFGKVDSNPRKRSGVKPVLIERFCHSIIYLTFFNSLKVLVLRTYVSLRARKLTNARNVYNHIHEATKNVDSVLLIGCSEYCRPKSLWSCVEINYQRAFVYGNKSTRCIDLLDWTTDERFSVILANGIIGYGINGIKDVYSLVDKCYELSATKSEIYISINETLKIKDMAPELEIKLLNYIKDNERFDSILEIGRDAQSLNYSLFRVNTK